MQSKARIGSHPIHPMLVAVPIGLWIFSWVADIFYLMGMNSDWRLVSGYCLAGGCIGGVLAALPGLIDYAFIKTAQARRVATFHMVINIILVLLFTADFFIRLQYDFEVTRNTFTLSTIGIIFLGVSGWLGGELVYSHKIGVPDGESITVVKAGGEHDDEESEKKPYSQTWASN